MLHVSFYIYILNKDGSQTPISIMSILVEHSMGEILNRHLAISETHIIVEFGYCDLLSFSYFH